MRSRCSISSTTVATTPNERIRKLLTMPYGCREKEYGKKFSVEKGTLIESSKMGHQTWVFAIYIVMTRLKGVSSMKLHRDLEIGQKVAWFLLHRLREAMTAEDFLSSGPVEADETYVSGKEADKHVDKRIRATGGPLGKAVCGRHRPHQRHGGILHDAQTGIPWHVSPDFSQAHRP